MRLDEIARALDSRARRKPGGGWLVRCPVHADNDPSCSLDLSDEGTLLVYCFAGCSSLDILSAIKRLGFDEPHAEPVKPTRSKTDPPRKEWSPYADYLWRRGIPIHGTPAETYLKARGCRIPNCDDLLFLGDYEGWPTMMARVTCPVTDKPFTLHLTRLARDGSGKAPIEKARDVLPGHRQGGGVIRLTRDEDVTMGLGIAEGVETALCTGWQPIWSMVNAGNMRRFPVLEGIEALTIFADNDRSGTGLKAAQECAQRWRDAEREALIIIPREVGKDWADVKGAA